MLDNYEHGYTKALIDISSAFEGFSLNGTRLTKGLVMSLLHLLIHDAKARDLFRTYGGDVVFEIAPGNKCIGIQEDR